MRMSDAEWDAVLAVNLKGRVQLHESGGPPHV
jgi:hypothetical protein